MFQRVAEKQRCKVGSKYNKTWRTRPYLMPRCKKKENINTNIYEAHIPRCSVLRSHGAKSNVWWHALTPCRSDLALSRSRKILDLGHARVWSILSAFMVVWQVKCWFMCCLLIFGRSFDLSRFMQKCAAQIDQSRTPVMGRSAAWSRPLVVNQPPCKGFVRGNWSTGFLDYIIP